MQSAHIVVLLLKEACKEFSVDLLSHEHQDRRLWILIKKLLKALFLLVFRNKFNLLENIFLSTPWLSNRDHSRGSQILPCHLFNLGKHCGREHDESLVEFLSSDHSFFLGYCFSFFFTLLEVLGNLVEDKVHGFFETKVNHLVSFI